MITSGGYLELTIDGKSIAGAYNAVTRDGQVTAKADALTIGPVAGARRVGPVR